MFVLKEDGSLIPMKATQFKLEEDFQRLLELHPELLAGDLIDTEEPRRWVLVTREVAIPSEADGVGWWSADHLFLDQDGIPTIVEVKRQTDTRLRREVVGQMLDYAANAVAYLPVVEIRSRFERTCEKKGTEPDQELQARLGQGIDAEKFWLQVKTNLEAQRIRLLFVADSIPRELRRVVEFLNRQMNPAEVLALELRQFSGEAGLRTLIPTLYGQTEEAKGAKAASASRNWNEESIFTELSTRQPDSVQPARTIAGWIRLTPIRFCTVTEVSMVPCQRCSSTKVRSCIRSCFQQWASSTSTSVIASAVLSKAWRSVGSGWTDSMESDYPCKQTASRSTQVCRLPYSRRRSVSRSSCR